MVRSASETLLTLRKQLEAYTPSTQLDAVLQQLDEVESAGEGLGDVTKTFRKCLDEQSITLAEAELKVEITGAIESLASTLEEIGDDLQESIDALQEHFQDRADELESNWSWVEETKQAVEELDELWKSIDDIHCSTCNGQYNPNEATEDGGCPICKRAEEVKKLSALPIDQRGGQTAFATKEQAQKAFNSFLAAVKSEVIYLMPSPSRILGEEEGISWNEIPRATVMFAFEVGFNLPPHEYIAEYTSQPARLSAKFFDDVKAAALEHLKSRAINWNNTRSHGFVYLDGRQGEG